MDIGTGVAIAGAWIFSGLVCHSSTTTNYGFWVSVIVSVLITWWLK